MSDVPTVSVVLACFNGARWLNEAINSVLGQTFRDFEFIIVDDGSTDTSPAIIGAAAKGDERIVVITKQNTGLADSLNVGISKARGEWIARLDADDLCSPSRLQDQVDRASIQPKAVFVGTGLHQITADGIETATFTYPETHAGLLRRLERMQGFPPHSSAMFRRDAFEKAGGYRPKITRAEDWDLWLRLSEIGELTSVAKPLVSIRQHEHQLSNDVETQLTQAYAATAAHFLRLRDGIDPLARSPENLLSWSRRWLDDHQVFERRRTWQVAKEAYQNTAAHRLARTARLAIDLTSSGHPLDFAVTQLFGSSIGSRLARAWRREDIRAGRAGLIGEYGV